MKSRKLLFFLIFMGPLSTLMSCQSPSPEATSSSDGASEASESEAPDAASPNQALLNEVAAAATWFHAKKTRPIWARQAEKDQMVTTIEGEETVKAGDYLCRGEAGDVWPQKEERLLSKYQATDTVEDGWRLYTPNPDSTGVMAAQVDHAFTVEASWGTLSGKSGDFVVKNFEDRDVAHPADVWIVDQALFRATYAKVEADQDGARPAGGESQG